MKFFKIFVFLIFICVKSVSAQILHCPLKNLELIEKDSSFNYSSEPTVGISFKSSCDTVFSILAGRIVNFKDYTKNKHSITIEYKNSIRVTYSFIKNSELKVGATVSAGKIIGTLYSGDLKKKYVLLILVRKNNTYLTKNKIVNLFYNCIPSDQ